MYRGKPIGWRKMGGYWFAYYKSDKQMIKDKIRKG